MLIKLYIMLLKVFFKTKKTASKILTKNIDKKADCFLLGIYSGKENQKELVYLYKRYGERIILSIFDKIDFTKIKSFRNKIDILYIVENYIHPKPYICEKIKGEIIRSETKKTHPLLNKIKKERDLYLSYHQRFPSAIEVSKSNFAALKLCANIKKYLSGELEYKEEHEKETVNNNNFFLFCTPLVQNKYISDSEIILH